MISLPTQVQTTVAIASLRIKVTGANVDYVGSVTVDSKLCDHLGLKDRQLVQIRNERTGVDLWTYIIYGRRSSSVPAGTLCLNGAAAHLVNVGDTVALTAWAGLSLGAGSRPPEILTWDAAANGFEPERVAVDDPWVSMLSVDIAIGKVHRPRISQVVDQGADKGPSVALDQDWMNEAGLVEGQNVHVVNINTGQRDVMPLKSAASGSGQCILTMKNAGAFSETSYGSRAGYYKNDIIIVMAYASVPYTALASGKVPMMRISFPVEQMVDPVEDTLNTSWHYTTRVVWDEPKLAGGLIKLLDLKNKDLRILDCSCGNAFPALYLVKAGVKFHMSDGSDLVCKVARERLAEELGPDHGVDVRCVLWNNLAEEYGKHAFDVIIWRGNSLPYVGGDWSAPSSSDASRAAVGYQSLHGAAKGIFDCLAPGGKLYVDCVPASAAKGVVIKKQGVVPDGNKAKVELEWEFKVDEEMRARKWSSTTVIQEDGCETRTMNANLTALLVREQEVRSVLSYVGFGRIESKVCEGEDIYQPFICSKPEAENGHYDRQVERYRRVWNDNGKILWGLFEGSAPSVMSPEMIKMSRVTGKGALVGSNLAMQAYMVSKLDPIKVESILDVGCGTGVSTLDLALQFTDAKCVGCDPWGVGIDQGRSRLENQGSGVSDRVSFFHGTVQDLAASKTVDPGSFSAAWSEGTLSHAPPADRMEAIRAISKQLVVGGMFVMNDTVAGHMQVSAAAQLHFYERLHYTGLWTKKMYIDVLESCGFEVVEFVDLTQHQAASYSALSAEATTAAEEAKGDDEEARQTYDTMAYDYEISATAALRGELGWSLFVCKKVTQIE